MFLFNQAKKREINILLPLGDKIFKKSWFDSNQVSLVEVKIKIKVFIRPTVDSRKNCANYNADAVYVLARLLRLKSLIMIIL